MLRRCDVGSRANEALANAGAFCLRNADHKGRHYIEEKWPTIKVGPTELKTADHEGRRYIKSGK
jgi:hypothetical protein